MSWCRLVLSSTKTELRPPRRPDKASARARDRQSLSLIGRTLESLVCRDPGARLQTGTDRERPVFSDRHDPPPCRLAGQPGRTFWGADLQIRAGRSSDGTSTGLCAWGRATRPAGRASGGGDRRLSCRGRSCRRQLSGGPSSDKRRAPEAGEPGSCRRGQGVKVSSLRYWSDRFESLVSAPGALRGWPAGGVVGLEHEYRVWLGRHLVDFRTVVHHLNLGRPRLDPADLNAYRLESGAVLTADETEAELALAPMFVGPGCGQLLAAAAGLGSARPRPSHTGGRPP